MNKLAVASGVVALALGGVGVAMAQGGMTTVPTPVGATVNGFTYQPVLHAYQTTDIQGIESCTYDPVRNVIVFPSGGPGGAAVSNAFATFVNSDGTVHTSKYIDATQEGYNWINALGSDVHNGILYVVDNVNAANDRRIRRFNLETKQQLPDIQVPNELITGTQGFNDVAVARDGTVYATVTISGTPADQRVIKITADGVASVFLRSPPLLGPNGIAIGADGTSVVVANITPAIGGVAQRGAVQTYNAAGELVRTQTVDVGGLDGLVVLPNGVIYASTSTAAAPGAGAGTIFMIRPGEDTGVAIVTGTGGANDMCYDVAGHQLVSVRGTGQQMTFVPLDPADKPATAAASGPTFTTFSITQQEGLRAAGTGLPAPVAGSFPAGGDVLFTVSINGVSREYAMVTPNDPTDEHSSSRLNILLTQFAALLNGQKFGDATVTAGYEITAIGRTANGRLTIATDRPATYDTFTVLFVAGPAAGPGAGTTSINYFSSLTR